MGTEEAQLVEPAMEWARRSPSGAVREGTGETRGSTTEGRRAAMDRSVDGIEFPTAQVRVPATVESATAFKTCPDCAEEVRAAAPASIHFCGCGPVRQSWIQWLIRGPGRSLAFPPVNDRGQPNSSQTRSVSQSGGLAPASSSRYSRTLTPTSHDARAILSPLRSRSRLSIVANNRHGLDPRRSREGAPRSEDRPWSDDDLAPMDGK